MYELPMIQIGTRYSKLMHCLITLTNYKCFSLFNQIGAIEIKVSSFTLYIYLTKLESFWCCVLNVQKNCVNYPVTVEKANFRFKIPNAHSS